MIKKRVAILAAVVAIVGCSLCGCSRSGISPDLLPHLVDKPSATPVRPIDALETVEMSLGGDERARVEELYSIVVYDGKKPVFADGDPLAAVYDEAIAILDRYVLNEWHGSAEGEYNIVHTVHDYLVSYIDYDFDLYDAYRNGDGDAMTSPSFDIDGVLLNKLAVCDGLSRTFNFLCAIEGIESVRVTGSFMGVPHAWNKVSVGGKWYNVDVTADAVNYLYGSDSYKQVSHGYFMLSDRTFRNFKAGSPALTHVFEGEFTAFDDYDYYADKAITVDGVGYPCVITDESALYALFEAIGKQNGSIGKIEIRLAFPDKANVNDTDMYATEIAAAYSKLRSPDFTVTATQKPYFQSPNGVYMFLMYR